MYYLFWLGVESHLVVMSAHEYLFSLAKLDIQIVDPTVLDNMFDLQ